MREMREEKGVQEEQREAEEADEEVEGPPATEDDSLDRSDLSDGGHTASKRAVRTRRSLRGAMRLTRSSGPVALADSREWPELDERRRRRRRARGSGKQKKAAQLRRMRRTPLSLLPNPPATLLPLLPLLTCPVCNQLFVQAVSLPCSHSFCAYCLHSRLQLKRSACPECEAAVGDEERKRGTYATRSAALDSLAEAVALQTLDVKGKRARARRQRVDAADMKHVRAAWKRVQGAERSRERRRRERERVEEELSALLGRRRRTHGSRRQGRQATDGEEEEDADFVPGQAAGSDSDEDDDDFVPVSSVESDDSAAMQQSDSQSADPTDSDGSSSEEREAAASSAASGEAGSSDDIDSSEEGSVDVDRSLILRHSPHSPTAPRRARPQRTRYEFQSVPSRSRPPCRGCSLPLSARELAVRVTHGRDVRWSHISCLRFSAAGRTIPLQRIDGMTQLPAQEQHAVRQAWHREADDGRDGDDVGEGESSGEEEEEEDGRQSDGSAGQQSDCTS